LSFRRGSPIEFIDLAAVRDKCIGGFRRQLAPVEVAGAVCDVKAWPQPMEVPKQIFLLISTYQRVLGMPGIK
jgi:hypothetical protein